MSGDLPPSFSDEYVSSVNSSTANLGILASFQGQFENVVDAETVAITFKSDQPVLIQVFQSSDGVNADVSDTYTVAANTGDSRSFELLSSFLKVVVTNTGIASSTFSRLQTIYSPNGDVVPRSLTQLGNLKVAIQELASQGVSGSSVSGVILVGGQDEEGLLRPVKITDNNDLKTADIANTATQSQIIILDGLNWIEAKGGSTRLKDRKAVVMSSASGGFFWNFVTGFGFPICINQVYPIGAGDKLPVYMYSSVSGTPVKVTEVS